MMDMDEDARRKAQAQFCAEIKLACEGSLDGHARMVRSNTGLTSLSSDGTYYWFDYDRPSDSKCYWDFVAYPGQMHCMQHSWTPNRPMSALERLAKVAE